MPPTDGRKKVFMMEETISGVEEQAAVAPHGVEETQVADQERSVPLAALESERAKRQQLEERFRQYEEENRLMRENLMMMNSQRSQPKAKDELEGLDDNDVLTVGDFKKLSSKMANQFSMTLEELKMTQKYPDYQEVITKHLPEVLKTNPGLRSSLEKSQDYELAYYLARNSESYKSENKKAKKNEDAERILQNSQMSPGLSSVGSSTPVKMAKNYKNMSDDEFRALMTRNLGY